MKTLDSESEGPAGSLERLGAEIVAEIKKGTNHLTAAGQKLLEAKRRSDAGEFGEPNFPNFLRLHCRNMSQSWAYQLMAVARGEMTVEELRSKAAERQRQCRERKKTASAPTAETKAELAKNKTEPAKPDLAKAEPTKLSRRFLEQQSSGPPLGQPLQVHHR